MEYFRFNRTMRFYGYTGRVDVVNNGALVTRKELERLIGPYHPMWNPTKPDDFLGRECELVNINKNRTFKTDSGNRYAF